MVAFSRLQLAAALLEYDNDPDHSNPPKRAEDSAIFSHIRTRDGPRARTLTGFEHVRETPNLLGVELPIDAVSTRGSIDVRRSIANTARMSRGSIDMLRNPFGGDDAAEAESEKEAEEEEEYQEEEELEVDLEAWGMAEFLGDKEKNKEKLRAERRARRISKAQSETIQPDPTTDEFGRLKRPGHLPQGMRSKSMGGMEGLPEEIRTIRGNIVATEGDFRRRTVSGPLDIMGRQTPDFGKPRSTAVLNKGLQVHGSPRGTPRGPSPLQVPFPTSPPDQGEESRSIFEFPLGASTSRFDPRFSHLRTMSSGVSESNMMLGYDRTQQSELSLDDDPSGTLSDRASRFDPRPSYGVRPLSGVSVGGTLGETQGFAHDNPFSLPPPSQTYASRFDPKAMAYTRTISDASLGSRLPPDFDRTSVASGQMLEGPRKPRPLSRLELLRPKVLIMPSPLQEVEEASVPPPPDVPVGFQVSSVGPPLPPGAKSNRPVSQFPLPPNGTSSLTPNPRLSLSLAQLTFRNSLMTGGQRDPSFGDIEQNLRRAQQDGEQIYQEDDIEEEIAEEQKQAQGRAPGKLYGRSLMDELEARKEKMRSKQRVFTGDQRPLMMSRGQIRRSSTLIDPNSLQEGPSSQTFNNNNNNRPGLTRKVSSGSGPLLSFGNENATNPVDGRGAKSVFGVDQLWERELTKLKEIEASEKAEEENRRKMEEEKAAKKAKKVTHKDVQKQPQPVQGHEREEPAPRLSRLPELPPTLPDIPKATARRAPAPVDYDSETDSEASEIEAKAKLTQQKSEVQGWVSSDDEEKPKLLRSPASEDSEDDVPLARVLLNPPLREPASDSEDEQPLARVLEQKSAFIPNIDFDNLHTTNDDDDDAPLGLKHPRASAFLTPSAVGDDEEDDDKPLALKQLQGRQPPPQFNFMAQQPMMMMQPQMTGSMVFPHQSMMSGFSPFIMGAPAFNMPPPPSVADSTKYATVDRWRRDVVAD